MADKRQFKHAVTGVVQEYDDAFAALYPDLEPVDGDVPCISCQPDPAEVAALAAEAPTKAEPATKKAAKEDKA